MFAGLDAREQTVTADESLIDPVYFVILAYISLA
jgi:hypothetical protein